ncbi:MAG: hypothetical protein ACI9JP_000869, partial [Granulosicoccus sp.]
QNISQESDRGAPRGEAVSNLSMSIMMGYDY